MKKRSFALAMAFVLTLALTGCSAGREGNTMQPSHNVSGDHSDARSSDGVFGIDDGNDALQGGGAGGTNDRNNDGLPDGSIGSDVGQAADDIGRAAGDLARGAGDAVRDAGDAIGNAADDVGRAMR